ncbi:MAG: glycosyltransferase 87 family protein [Pirellulaceae bacterium]
MPKFPIPRETQRFLLTIALMAVVLSIGLTAYRIVRAHQTPGPFDPARQGFCDFQNGVYFPSLAFRHGLSPYGQQYAREYPVERSIPFFSPAIVAAHVPFTWLSLPVAECLYFIGMLLLIAAIASLTAQWTTRSVSAAAEACMLDNRLSTRLVFAAVVLALVTTRGGQQTLFTGYFTFELVLASLLAVHYARSRPWLSACALIVVSAKPNYVLPLALLMLCRGNVKAVLAGGVLSAALAIAAFAWIMPPGGASELLEQIQQTQDIHRGDAVERPINTWIRVDILAIVAKWTESDPAELATLLVMLGFLIPAGVMISRREFGQSSASHTHTAIDLSGTVILLTALVSVYHHVYDALTLLAPAAALAIGAHTDWQAMRPRGRMLLCGLLLAPGANYLSSQKFLAAWTPESPVYMLLTSVNAVLLFIAWLWLLVLLYRQTSGERATCSRS